MKKLMMITTVITLNFLVFNFSMTNLYSNSENIKSSRAPASSSGRIMTHLDSAQNFKQGVKKSWSFNYKDLSKKPFSIKKEASSYEEAYKSASQDCFQQLTNGKYPGEEKGLDIIDICANPKT